LFIIYGWNSSFNGIFSKQFVLYSAIESGYYFMAILGILVSIISASYYLRIIRILHTDSTAANDIKIKSTLQRKKI